MGSSTIVKMAGDLAKKVRESMLIKCNNEQLETLVSETMSAIEQLKQFQDRHCVYDCNGALRSIRSRIELLENTVRAITVDLDKFGSQRSEFDACLVDANNELNKHVMETTCAFAVIEDQLKSSYRRSIEFDRLCLTLPGRIRWLLAGKKVR